MAARQLPDSIARAIYEFAGRYSIPREDLDGFLGGTLLADDGLIAKAEQEHARNEELENVRALAALDQRVADATGLDRSEVAKRREGLPANELARIQAIESDAGFFDALSGAIKSGGTSPTSAGPAPRNEREALDLDAKIEAATRRVFDPALDRNSAEYKLLVQQRSDLYAQRFGTGDRNAADEPGAAPAPAAPAGDAQ